MISYGKGLQKELKNLSLKYLKDRNKRDIACYKEFYNEFNLYLSNTTNNSMLLYVLILLPLDSSIDSSKFIYSTGCRYKYKQNITNEITYINSLNKISSLLNKKKFYYKKRQKYIHIIYYNTGMMIDQPGKFLYLNFIG